MIYDKTTKSKKSGASSSEPTTLTPKLIKVRPYKKYIKDDHIFEIALGYLGEVIALASGKLLLEYLLYKPKKAIEGEEILLNKSPSFLTVNFCSKVGLPIIDCIRSIINIKEIYNKSTFSLMSVSVFLGSCAVCYNCMNSILSQDEKPKFLEIALNHFTLLGLEYVTYRNNDYCHKCI